LWETSPAECPVHIEMDLIFNPVGRATFSSSSTSCPIDNKRSGLASAASDLIVTSARTHKIRSKQRRLDPRLSHLCFVATFLLLTIASLHRATAQNATITPAREPAYGPELEGYDYPYPVHQFEFSSQKQTMHMAYMDVQPKSFNGQVIVLMHGKNFCSATWKTSIDVLENAGYRVIAVDQIGFCKSTKPHAYQYTFQQLARNTHALLESLGIQKAILVAHSTGGMIAIRYALMYPAATSQLVLVDPIGLEDWKAKGVPSISVDQWYERELQTNAGKIRQYEQYTYYAGTWSDSYEPWVQMLAGMYRGPGKDLVAWNSALLYDMIYTQPVYYEFEHITVPTFLLIGDKDNTAIGKDLAPPTVQAQLGHYPELAKQAVARIPNAKLVEFPDMGHAPQIQNPATFHAALLKGLIALPSPNPK
jgi:pimeloyl-ACP methyl ester carboxylesterase